MTSRAGCQEDRSCLRPAVDKILDDMHFVLEDGFRISRDDYYWKIIDQRGLTMMEGNLLFRNGRITIDTEDIPNGLYHLVMGLENKPLMYRKIAIMHR